MSTSAEAKDQQSNVQTCSVAIRTIGDYVPEVQSGDASLLKVSLTQLSQALSPGNIGETHAKLRSALQSYQHQTHGRLRQMHERISVAQNAIEEFSGGLSTGAATHETSVREHLDTLESVAGAGDLIQLRGALGEACQSVRVSHARLVRGQQLATLQLREEIRLLQATIEAHKREREGDPESGMWRREYIDREIRARLQRSEPFSVLLMTIHNLPKLQRDNAPDAIHELLDAFFKRLARIVAPGVVIARWTPKAFALLLQETGAAAEELRDRICGRLPGAYSIHVEGVSHVVVLDLSVALLDPAVEFSAHR